MPISPSHTPISPMYSATETLEKETTNFMFCKQEFIGVTFAPKHTRSQKRKLGCLCDTESEQNAILNNRPHTGPKLL